MLLIIILKGVFILRYYHLCIEKRASIHTARTDHMLLILTFSALGMHPFSFCDTF